MCQGLPGCTIANQPQHGVAAGFHRAGMSAPAPATLAGMPGELQQFALGHQNKRQCMLRDLLRTHRTDVRTKDAFCAEGVDVDVIEADGCLHQHSAATHPGHQRRVDDHRVKSDYSIGPCQLLIRRVGGDLQGMALLCCSCAVLSGIDVVHSRRIDQQYVHGLPYSPIVSMPDRLRTRGMSGLLK
ncbi:hypothetical protein D3C79_613300 [compost metagenome]